MSNFRSFLKNREMGETLGSEEEKIAPEQLEENPVDVLFNVLVEDALCSESKRDKSSPTNIKQRKIHHLTFVAVAAPSILHTFHSDNRTPTKR